jgi:hypothetical protein
MSARDLLPEIRQNARESESLNDIVLMVDTLAQLRAEERRTAADDETTAAGKIFCVIFDLFKTSAYRSYATRIRFALQGIATNPSVARSRLIAAIPRSFIVDDPLRIFKRHAISSKGVDTAPGQSMDLIASVAEVYSLDIDKVRRLFEATARVLQLRLQVHRANSIEVMNRVFRVALRERTRIRNPYAWILNAAVYLGARWVPPPAKIERPATFEELVRAVDDDDLDAEVDLLGED